MRKRRTVYVGIALIAALPAALATVLAVPASAGAVPARAVSARAASVPAVPPTLPATLPPSVTSGTATTSFTPDDVITCTVNVQNPHNSSHVHGTINTIATILCTGAMEELAQSVGLYYADKLVGQSYNSNTGSPSLTGNFATACKTGFYTGASAWLEVPPPGYEPPYSEGVDYSNTVYIDC
jgi:hypothetical protein